MLHALLSISLDGYSPVVKEDPQLVFFCCFINLSFNYSAISPSRVLQHYLISILQHMPTFLYLGSALPLAYCGGDFLCAAWVLNIARFILTGFYLINKL